MIEAAIYIAIGLFLGWNLPQPGFAARLQARFLGLFS